ncbi:MAG: hypothetical protein ABW170_22635 [Candidatus Thiodiazotropha sp. L084R]
MTQIIAVITQEFITVVSDRRLSYLNEDGSFKCIKTDNECKLVSLCEHSCIAYTGLAQLDGIATHEWITRTLKKHKCIDAWLAGKILAKECKAPLENISKSYSHMTFLITGWKYTNKGLLPYMLRISNAYHHDDSWIKLATNNFRYKIICLLPDEVSESMVVGVPLKRAQDRRIKRHIRKTTIRRSLPLATLEYLSKEIVLTNSSMVGNNVLGVIIPKNQIEETKKAGLVTICHHAPNKSRSTFTYYEEGSNGLEIFGPSFVCGDSGIIDFSGSTKNGVVSASFRVL